MKFRPLFISFLFFAHSAFSQCCCGNFYFRMYDPAEKVVYPKPEDSFLLKIDPLEKQIGHARTVEKKSLGGGLMLEILATEGNAGTAPLNLLKYPFTDLLLTFATGCETQLKRISVSKNGQRMILNIVNIPANTEIMMDSILFVPGEYTYNISNIITDQKLTFVEQGPEKKMYLHYNIPAQSLPAFTGAPGYVKEHLNSERMYFSGEADYNLTPVIKNDTAFFYYDSERTTLLGKGRQVWYRKKCRKVSFEEKQFRDNDKEQRKSDCRKAYKYGTWQFYDREGYLTLVCNFKKKRTFPFGRSSTVAHGFWTYYDNNGKIILIETYRDGKLLAESGKP